jgi:hypothetical protein
MTIEKATKIINRRYTAGMENDFKILRAEVIRLRAVNAELVKALSECADAARAIWSQSPEGRAYLAKIDKLLSSHRALLAELGE